MERVRIGLAGAVHPNMPGDDTGLVLKIKERLAALTSTLEFDLSAFPEPLRSEEDAERARQFMDRERVDFTLLFNASLPYGRVILPLARVKSRLGLWSVPEPTRDGVLQLNSFCGTNMLGAIVTNYLRHHQLKLKWFYGLPDSDRFLERFQEVGYEQVFTITLMAQLLVALLFGGAFFLILYANLNLASRLSERTQLIFREGAVTLPPFGVDSHLLKRIILIASLVLSLFVAQQAGADWEQLLRFIKATPFGIKDPLFNRDIGFYVFQLPFLHQVYSWLMAVLVITALATGLIYLMRRALLFIRPKPCNLPRPPARTCWSCSRRSS